MTTANQRTPKKVWFGVVALWVVYLGAVWLAYTDHPAGAGDFASFYAGARAYVTDQPLYTSLDVSMPYVYPPLLALMIAPLAASGDFKLAAKLWLVINIVCLIAALALINRTIGSPRVKPWFWVLPLLFLPTFQSLWLGQTTLILFLLGVGVWLCVREKRPIDAGVLLALSIWIKLHPALFILYFVWKRDWRVVGSTCLALIFLGVIQVGLTGMGTVVGYFSEILLPYASEGRPNLNHSNASVLGFAQRLFSENPQVISLADSPTLLLLTRLGLTALLIGGTLYALWRVRKQADSSTESFDLEYGLVMMIALLFGSTLGIHALMPLLLVYISILRAVERHQRKRFGLWLTLSAALINLHFFIILGYLKPPSDITLPALALSMPFFGTLLAWGLSLLALRRWLARSLLMRGG